jgi:hypothetical protein
MIYLKPLLALSLYHNNQKGEPMASKFVREWDRHGISTFASNLMQALHVLRANALFEE